MSRIAFTNGQIYSHGTWLDSASLTLAGGKIMAIDPANGAEDIAVDLAGGTLVPGYIDVQVNGGGGVLFNDDPTATGIATIARAHARFGSTAIVPTLISALPEVIAAGLDAVDDAITANVAGCIGIHVEGPVLSRARKGIHSERNLRPLDDALIELLTRPRAGRVLFTVAPEYLGQDQARALLEAGVILSIGHSEADYDQTRRAFAMGATGVTHLFNAMSGLHHRAPGMVGAALENQEAWCGLIVDGFHFHPAMLGIALRARPLDRFMLVTDAMSCVGSDLTQFELDGTTIYVSEGRCVDAHGTLAGATLDMGTAVRNTINMGGVSLSQAIDMASRNPAAFLGLDTERGTIGIGMTADFVQLDADHRPVATWIAGQQVA
ncbi:N-acetylglucosamine 6-phosphate deacetylase [Novosphingobium sp. Rr 2-17]|uniref:N-acetylglucosamine-6-phosphate deacetylase n=1 Tax=Novosphingobium sp. Rr 2-17 TaxID=555793 RepID=UPI0002697EE4|nr:N-acetylglucosamine-6-phosphate deacetylase [Novosphingobium sp. Rr 2-17]EIZ78361.1 N-acetylglucosamine 6-phosphate deacetylase [Novosphingobium sp. Rr 2-17]